MHISRFFTWIKAVTSSNLDPDKQINAEHTWQHVLETQSGSLHICPYLEIRTVLRWAMRPAGGATESLHRLPVVRLQPRQEGRQGRCIYHHKTGKVVKCGFKIKHICFLKINIVHININKCLANQSFKLKLANHISVYYFLSWFSRWEQTSPYKEYLPLFTTCTVFPMRMNVRSVHSQTTIDCATIF